MNTVTINDQPEPQMISAPATCLQCGTVFISPTTGKLLNRCGCCGGTLKTDAPQIGVHKIALRVSNLEVVAGLRERLTAAASFGSGKTSRDHLVWMCDKLLKDGVPYMPIDKSGRWIGFVQGVMAANGCLDVDAERDRTRPLYERAYFKPWP